MIFNTSRGAEAFWKFGNLPGLRVSLMRLLRGQYLRAAPAARGNGSLGSIFMRGPGEGMGAAGGGCWILFTDVGPHLCDQCARRV